MTQQEFETHWPLIKKMISRDVVGINKGALNACRGQRGQLKAMLCQCYDLNEEEADGAIAYYEQAVEVNADWPRSSA